MNRYNKLRSLLETRLPVSEVPREGHSDKLGKPWSKAAINARKWALKNPEAAESGFNEACKILPTTAITMRRVVEEVASKVQFKKSGVMDS